MAARSRRGGGAARSASPPTPKAAPTATAWDKIAAGREGRRRRSSSPTPSSRTALAFDSQLFGIASDLVRLAAEKAQAQRRAAPRVPRLGAARRSSSSSSRRRRSIPSSRRPSSPTRSSWMLEGAGRRRPARRRVLARPDARQARAHELVDGHQARRRRPSARSWPTAARRRSTRVDDPMIKLALAVDADARAAPQAVRGQVEGVETAQLRADRPGASSPRRGTSRYPDATFTLRLSFGTVKGYESRRQDDPADHHDRRRSSTRAARPTTSRRTSCRQRWLERARPSSTARRRSTSSRRPTSSAATRAARSSTATTRSSA